MRPVAVIAAAQTVHQPWSGDLSTLEMAYEVCREAVAASGLERREIELAVSGSADVLEGRAFSFGASLEAMGTYPATLESHLEMDGAWAAYYAWLKIVAGEVDAALVLGWGKSSEGSLHHVLNSQLDPLVLAPLGLDHVTSAALQADAWLRACGDGPARLDDVVAAAVAHAAGNKHAASMRAARLAEDDAALASPLWRRHCPPVTDGACAVVLAAGELAARATARAWVRGADHRTEPGALAQRDLSRLRSAEEAAAAAGRMAGWGPDQVDVAELGSSFAHQEPMLAEALGLRDDVVRNPSGGPLVADPLMATGLVRLAEAFTQVTGRAGGHQVDGARRAVAHGGAGHALQQSIVWLLEGEA